MTLINHFYLLGIPGLKILIGVLSVALLLLVIRNIVKAPTYDEVWCRKKIPPNNKVMMAEPLEYFVLKIYKKTGEYVAIPKKGGPSFSLNDEQKEEIRKQLDNGEEHPELTF